MVASFNMICSALGIVSLTGLGKRLFSVSTGQASKLIIYNIDP